MLQCFSTVPLRMGCLSNPKLLRECKKRKKYKCMVEKANNIYCLYRRQKSKVKVRIIDLRTLQLPCYNLQHGLLSDRMPNIVKKLRVKMKLFTLNQSYFISVLGFNTSFKFVYQANQTKEGANIWKLPASRSDHVTGLLDSNMTENGDTSKSIVTLVNQISFTAQVLYLRFHSKVLDQIQKHCANCKAIANASIPTRCSRTTAGATTFKYRIESTANFIGIEDTYDESSLRKNNRRS